MQRTCNGEYVPLDDAFPSFLGRLRGPRNFLSLLALKKHLNPVIIYNSQCRLQNELTVTRKDNPCLGTIPLLKRLEPNVRLFNVKVSVRRIQVIRQSHYRSRAEPNEDINVVRGFR